MLDIESFSIFAPQRTINNIKPIYNHRKTLEILRSNQQKRRKSKTCNGQLPTNGHLLKNHYIIR